MLQWLPDNLHVLETRPELHPEKTKNKIWVGGRTLSSSAQQTKFRIKLSFISENEEKKQTIRED